MTYDDDTHSTEGFVCKQWSVLVLTMRYLILAHTCSECTALALSKQGTSDHIRCQNGLPDKFAADGPDSLRQNRERTAWGETENQIK